MLYSRRARAGHKAAVPPQLFTNKFGKRVVLSAAPQYGMTVNQMSILFNAAGDVLSLTQGRAVPISRSNVPELNYSADPTWQFLLRHKRYQDLQYSTLLTLTETPIDSERGLQVWPQTPQSVGCREFSCGMGDLVVEAMHAECLKVIGPPGCDAALINGGALSTGVIPPGNVTTNDVIKFFPFGDYLVIAQFRGAVLIEALRSGTSNVFRGSNSGWFPQTSMRFMYNPNTSIPRYKIPSAEIRASPPR